MSVSPNLITTTTTPTTRGHGAPCRFCGEPIKRLSPAAVFCTATCKTLARKYELRRERAERLAAAEVTAEVPPARPVPAAPPTPPRPRHLPATRVRRPWLKASEVRRTLVERMRHG
jgi:hypothetical protein